MDVPYNELNKQVCNAFNDFIVYDCSLNPRSQVLSFIREANPIPVMRHQLDSMLEIMGYASDYMKIFLKDWWIRICIFE